MSTTVLLWAMAATMNNVSAANGTLPPIVRASAAFEAACTGIRAPLITAIAQSNTVVLIERSFATRRQNPCR